MNNVCRQLSQSVADVVRWSVQTVVNHSLLRTRQTIPAMVFDALRGCANELLPPVHATFLERFAYNEENPDHEDVASVE